MHRKLLAVLLILFLSLQLLVQYKIAYASGVNYLGNYDQSTNFGVANDFNVFILEDAIKNGADSEGRIAIGGNATLGNFTVGSQLNNPTEADILVGGNFTLNGNLINQSGNTVYGDGLQTNGYNIWQNRKGTSVICSKVIDFDQAKSYLNDLSGKCAQLPDNSCSHNVAPWGELDLTGDNKTLNVFTFDGTNVFGSGKSLKDLEIHINVPNNSTILMNVSGDNLGFKNNSMFINGSEPNGKVWGNEKLVWNFYEATKLTGYTVHGSILAPKATWISSGCGNVQGRFIVKELLADNSNGWEFHDIPFTGCLPTSSPVNSNPIAENDAETTPENTAITINVLGNDRDPDNDPLTVTDVTQGSHGSVSINPDNTVKYTPETNYEGTDSFTYTIGDGKGGTATATVTVTVTSTNSPGQGCNDNPPPNPSDPRFAATNYSIVNYVGTSIGGFNGDEGSSDPKTFSPATSGEVYGPRGLSVDSNETLYIADEKNGSIRKVVFSNGSTNMSTITGNGKDNGYTPTDYQGSAHGQGMYEPMDVAVSPCGKYIYFLDTDNHIIRMIDESGNLRTIAGVLEPGSSGSYSDGGGNPLKAKFNTPQGIAIDKKGNLYIADTQNDIIRRISSDWTNIITIAGQAGIGGFSGDGGPAKEATLNNPIGLAFDSVGNLYVADTFNHRIRKIDLNTGIITTVAGGGKLPTNSTTAEGIGDDSSAVEASLFYPYDVAIDEADNLYIADSSNQRIRKVMHSTGEIITIAGDGYLGNSSDMADATSARLNWPKGVAVDRNGNVYISDTLNNVIKRLIPKL
ncbi:serine/threonine-protein kinase PknD [Desulfosporosinus acididurans]|uniref:Serine/threonine-protein kinase PknD n=1 Tax=Desulfosporosinus acididurans TaxID=476652 RepID=A0A0J1FSG2_9FIRM|nr:choice-of-anchor A family protein [Desulfosporosinus acididurans]KLU66425.1 serine/threonine-protein kinase PknD [Desulfosporosinus acididurans]